MKWELLTITISSGLHINHLRLNA